MRKTFIDSHIKISCVWVCMWRLKIFFMCSCLWMEKFADFSLILSFGSLPRSGICPMLLWMLFWCVAIVERFLLATTWNTQSTLHTNTNTSSRHVYIYLFVASFPITIHDHSAGVARQRRWPPSPQQSQHSTNSLVRMFVIHLACLFRYRLLQLMRNWQMYLRLSTLLVFGRERNAQCHRSASFSPFRCSSWRVGGCCLVRQWQYTSASSNGGILKRKCENEWGTKHIRIVCTHRVPRWFTFYFVVRWFFFFSPISFFSLVAAVAFISLQWRKVTVHIYSDAIAPSEKYREHGFRYIIIFFSAYKNRTVYRCLCAETWTNSRRLHLMCCVLCCHLMAFHHITL